MDVEIVLVTNTERQIMDMQIKYEMKGVKESKNGG
jgi:hypothetical protein